MSAKKKKINTQPVATIAEWCQDAESQYRADSLTSTDYLACHELFRRAIILRDQTAWHYVYEQYRQQVLGWVWQHPAYSKIDLLPEEVVNIVFAKFWKSVTKETFQQHLHSISAIMLYLKKCVSTCIYDEIRALARNPIINDKFELTQLSASSNNPENVVDIEMRQHALWENVAKLLNSEIERVVMEEVYVYGRKTDEVQRRFPHLFADKNAVYRAKANLLKRLKRNRELLLDTN